MFEAGQEDTAMNLDTIVHELVGIVMAQNNSGIVEIDDVLIALENMFPELSEADITICVMRDVERRDAAVAWLGHA